MKVSELLDPVSQGIRQAVERHHLFPKGYLAILGISDLRETNQIANFAFVEWGDNMKILDRAPEEYQPEMASRFTEAELSVMQRLHALPQNWEQMKYGDFLEKRREQIANIIREGYETLSIDTIVPENPLPKSIYDYVADGESHEVEFKSTLRVNLHTKSRDPRMEIAVLKTIAGFLNRNGGALTIGISDDGTPLGIEIDEFDNEDKMSLHLVNLVKDKMGPAVMQYIHVRFEDYEGSRVLVVESSKAKSPIFVKDGSTEHFYIRTGPSTTELSASQTQEYIRQRFGN
jgi:hypothetical protein